jgi:hypothetical protein
MDPLQIPACRVGGLPRDGGAVLDHRGPGDAVEVAVAGLDAQRLRFGFAADAEARRRLMGGSVTLDGRLILTAGLQDLDGRLILIAGLQDLDLVKRFVTRLGGDFGEATIRPGRREFVA